jgi:uncharacterized phiE125 gp8 family phage protein
MDHTASKIYAEPAIEPVSLADIKEHLRLNSGDLASTLITVQSIRPGLKAFVNDWTTHAGAAVDILGCTAVVNFDAGAFGAGGTVDVKIQESDTLTGAYTDWSTPFTQVTVDGMTTTAALAIGTTLTNVANGLFTYFIGGVPYSKPAYAAGTSPGADIIPVGKYGAVAFDIGADNTIDVIPAPNNGAGTYTTAALATAGLPVPNAGHVRMGSITATKSDGAFTFGTTQLNAINSTVAYTQATLKANYNTTYEIAYTGAKQYIKAVAKVLVADCSFGVSVVKSSGDITEDLILTALITAARQLVEAITRRALITQTWDLFLDHFPCKNYIPIPNGQLQSVVSMSYTDADGSLTPMTATTDYLVDASSEPGRIVLPYAVSWPSTTYYPVNPIAIRYICGFGATAASVPAGIRTAIKMLAEDLWNERSANHVMGASGSVTENKAVMNMLWPHRLWM